MASLQARNAANAEGGWDVGRIFTTQINAVDRDDAIPDLQEIAVARLETEARFFDFLREFTIEGRFLYRYEPSTSTLTQK
jgi:hypothetical protein